MLCIIHCLVRILHKLVSILAIPGEYADTYACVYAHLPAFYLHGLPETLMQFSGYSRSIVRFAALKPGQEESRPEDLYQITVVVKSE